eukprot:gene15502-6761_t
MVYLLREKTPWIYLMTNEIQQKFLIYSALRQDLSSLTLEERPGSRRGHRSLRTVANIETLVVVDKTMVEFHGEKHVKNYVLTIMNMVSNIFRDPSIGRPINIAIVRLIIIEKQRLDTFTVTYSAKATLQRFCLWQKRQNFDDHRHPYHHDVALLITRKDICGLGNFPCASIGMAMQGGMCSQKYSCSIVQDTGLNTAFTVAQMLGHNLGLKSLKRTTCGAFGGGSYIMSASRLRSPFTDRFQWSSCSRIQLARLLRKSAVYYGAQEIFNKLDAQLTENQRLKDLLVTSSTTSGALVASVFQGSKNHYLSMVIGGVGQDGPPAQGLVAVAFKKYQENATVQGKTF